VLENTSDDLKLQAHLIDKDIS